MTPPQALVTRVVAQFRRPQGLAGRAAGWIMAHRRSNVERNRWVVSLLDVRPSDRVLEIGFGPGIGIAEPSRRAVKGRVYGLDHSAVMVRQAARRNRAAIRSGLVELRQASVDSAWEFEHRFDKILAVNSMGFWPQPADQLTKLRSLLAPEGIVAIASQPRCPGADARTSAQAAAEIERTLHQAGYEVSRVETLELEPPVVCVIGEPRRSPNPRA